MHERRMGQRLGGLRLAVEQLARWWTSASSEEKFNLTRAAINGDADAPPYSTLQVAIFLAETESGSVDQR